MKIARIFLGLTFLGMVNSAIAQSNQQVVFDAPAKHFTESIPLGNGRLGAMVFGNPNQEHIVLNEGSMWSGGIENPNRSDAYQYLPEIQNLLKEGKNKEAQELLQRYFVSAGKGSGNGSGANAKFGCYQVLANLKINWKDTQEEFSNYKRILFLDKALALTKWKRNDVVFEEEVLSSAPADVIVIRLSASKAKKLNFSLAMDRKEKAQFSSAGNAITMTGQLAGGDGDLGIKFAGYAKIYYIRRKSSCSGRKTYRFRKFRMSYSIKCCY